MEDNEYMVYLHINEVHNSNNLFFSKDFRDAIML